MSNVKLTLANSQVKEIVESHHCEWTEFLADMGTRPFYWLSDVRVWLGY